MSDGDSKLAMPRSDKRTRDDDRSCSRDDRSASASEEGDEWFDCLEGAQSVQDGMRMVYEMDKEAFYSIGPEIEKMLTYRFEHKF
jgi:hypothetical protein